MAILQAKVTALLDLFPFLTGYAGIPDFPHIFNISYTAYDFPTHLYIPVRADDKSPESGKTHPVALFQFASEISLDKMEARVRKSVVGLLQGYEFIDGLIKLLEPLALDPERALYGMGIQFYIIEHQ